MYIYNIQKYIIYERKKCIVFDLSGIQIDPQVLWFVCTYSTSSVPPAVYTHA